MIYSENMFFVPAVWHPLSKTLRTEIQINSNECCQRSQHLGEDINTQKNDYWRDCVRSALENK